MLKGAAGEKQKEHAIDVMRGLGLSEDVIQAFKEGKFYLSRVGACFPLDEKYPDWEMIKKEIEQLEAFGHGMVYHVIYTNSMFGTIYSLLQVSDFEEDWPIEIGLYENKMAVAYCYNKTDTASSESGTIMVGNLNGSLVRVDM